jgi:hypothetical protein
MVNIPSFVKPLRGRSLGHVQLTKAKRAFRAADLVNGKRCMTDFTVGQAAYLYGVSPSYVHWALNRMVDRIPIETGVLPLVPRLAPSRQEQLARVVTQIVNRYGLDATLTTLAAAEERRQLVAAA